METSHLSASLLSQARWLSLGPSWCLLDPITSPRTQLPGPGEACVQVGPPPNPHQSAFVLFRSREGRSRCDKARKHSALRPGPWRRAPSAPGLWRGSPHPIHASEALSGPQPHQKSPLPHQPVGKLTINRIIQSVPGRAPSPGSLHCPFPWPQTFARPLQQPQASQDGLGVLTCLLGLPPLPQGSGAWALALPSGSPPAQPARTPPRLAPRICPTPSSLAELAQWGGSH